MSEESANKWRDVLREAISSCTPLPVPGTQLKGALDSSAAKRALRFPPTEEPTLRFIELLERYPDVVSILRRRGQDFLVAPAGKSNLLTDGIRNESYGIRRDLFDAFTRVSDSQPSYSKTKDCIEWHIAGEGQTLGGEWVPIQTTTMAAEVQLRRDFAEIAENSASRSLLLNALEGPIPFRAWSLTIKTAKLQRNWHSFRTKRLQEKIQRWASDNGIEWKGTWLTDRPTPYIPTKSPVSSSALVKHEESDPVRVLFSGLDVADMQRISIPLDLVLKIISSSKR